MIDNEQINDLIKRLGKEMINGIRMEYIEDSTQKIAHLLDAWNERNYQTLQEISHALKSSSLNMAMHTFSEQCQRIEQLASQHNENSVQAIINDLPNVYSASLKVLDTYFIDEVDKPEHSK